MFNVGDKVIPSESYKTRYSESPHNPRNCVGRVTQIRADGKMVNVDWGEIINIYEKCDLLLVEQEDHALSPCKFNIGDTVQLLGRDDIGTVQDIRVRKRGKWEVQVKWKKTQRTTAGWYYEENINFFEYTALSIDTTVNNLNIDNEKLFRISPTISYRSAPRGVSFCSPGKEIRVGN